MRRLLSLLSLVTACAMGAAPALATCSILMSIEQGAEGGNFFTDPGRAYGGWFWLAGHGNALLNGSSEGNIGIDSGTQGGVPLDSTPFGTSWLVDFFGDGSTRMTTFDWGSSGVDGCGDVDGSHLAEPGEVLAVLVIDSAGEEYALASVGGLGIASWSLGMVNNGVTSAQGTPGNGIPMTPVPEPQFGATREVPGGKVEVEVRLPTLREVPTYDDVGGGRQMVQGFQVLSGDQLLAEAHAGTPSVKVRARAGESIVLRTVFGAPGDVGFFVDGRGTVPGAGSPGSGEPARRPTEPAGSEAQPPEAVPAAPVSMGVVTEEPGAVEEDGDEDGLVDGEDNCPGVGNPEQEDVDEDGIGDACDLCPFDADEQQTDGDDDGLGDACDACPEDPTNQDQDGDAVCNATDNCPEAENAGQEDGDGDGIGDACDSTFDPFVVKVEPETAKALAGGSVALSLAVDNRADTRRTMELWVELIDAAEKSTRLEASPGCLEKVPWKRPVAPGERFELDCTVSLPEGAARGKASLRIVARDEDRPETPGEASVRLTIQ